MTREVYAIYKNGVLKLAEPLPFADDEPVRVTVSNGAAAKAQANSLREELVWIAENAHLYRGEWVAVQGSELVAYGPELKGVEAKALKAGMANPLFFSTPEQFGEPSVEWL